MLAASLLAALIFGSGCGSDSGKDEASSTAPRTYPVPADRSGPPPPGPIRGTPKDSESKAVVAAVRAYIADLNARRPAALCRLLAPGGLAGLHPPRGGPGCRSALRASIGYADPRGYPQWKRTKLELIKKVELDGDRARVTATVLHGFVDRETVSDEDDVVQLVKRGGRWLIAKPSATLYRAVGKPDVPAQALLAPR